MNTTAQQLAAPVTGQRPIDSRIYTKAYHDAADGDWLLITTEDADLAGDIVVASGVDLSAYLTNPVLLWAHDAYGYTPRAGLPIGTLADIAVLPGKGIRARIVWLEGDPFVDLCRNAWNQGALNAASIGFIPLQYDPHYMPDSGGRRITESRLLETSLVPIPMNPYALREKSVRAALDKSVLALLDFNAPPPAAPGAVTPDPKGAAVAAESRELKGSEQAPAAAPVGNEDKAEPRFAMDALVEVKVGKVLRKELLDHCKNAHGSLASVITACEKLEAQDEAEKAAQATVIGRAIVTIRKALPPEQIEQAKLIVAALDELAGMEEVEQAERDVIAEAADKLRPLAEGGDAPAMSEDETADEGMAVGVGDKAARPQILKELDEIAARLGDMNGTNDSHRNPGETSGRVADPAVGQAAKATRIRDALTATGLVLRGEAGQPLTAYAKEA